MYHAGCCGYYAIADAIDYEWWHDVKDFEEEPFSRHNMVSKIIQLQNGEEPSANPDEYLEISTVLSIVRAYKL
jgi:hypothetical protein